MKTNMLKSVLVLTTLALGIMALTGCGGVPSAYRGNFVDSTTGTKLTLKGSEGTYTNLQGQTTLTKSSELKFENLMAGQTGLYLMPHPRSEKLVEVFWMIPNAPTRQEAGGLVWFEAEVLYTVLDSQAKEVNGFDLDHCERGTLLIDTVSKTFQLGCGADAQQIHLVRTAN